MTAEQITAIVTGICTIIAAVGALIVSLRNHSQLKLQSTDANAKGQQLHEIHVLVNNKMTAALTEIADLRSHVAALTREPGDVALAGSAIARAAAPPVRDPVAPPPIPGVPSAAPPGPPAGKL